MPQNILAGAFTPEVSELYIYRLYLNGKAQYMQVIKLIIHL